LLLLLLFATAIYIHRAADVRCDANYERVDHDPHKSISSIEWGKLQNRVQL